MKYLSTKQLLLIHSAEIDETGGMHGVQDIKILHSLASQPQQSFNREELYPNVFTKAAVYVRNIIQSHPFLDGNKRTGISSGIIFLEYNGHQFKAERGEIEKFAIQVAKENTKIDKISAWLKKHSKKIN